MSNYSYVAVDPRGREMRGSLEVAGPIEALQRIKEMGLFPTKVLSAQEGRGRLRKARPAVRMGRRTIAFSIPGISGRIKPRVLTIFTRQLATLVEAGMPLLRSLRILHEQERTRPMKQILEDLALAIENGSSFAEAVSMHPRVFNRLYVNMVKAGEISGALELTLKRLADFMEKAQKIKGRIKSSLFYPVAVLLVAAAIVVILMIFVVPKFKMVFDGLLAGRPMPAFTVFVMGLSEMIRSHVVFLALSLMVAGTTFAMAIRTRWGRWGFDLVKLRLPILGTVFKKASLSRFARTLGTLVNSGVPILQSLTIVKETAGNVVVADVVAKVHENVKQGDAIAPTLKASGIFPAMVAGMVEVGEQTGALPDMLMKIADTCDEDVDNATNAMTSLLEPILVVFLAVVVGSIVIAVFLPLIRITEEGFEDRSVKAD